MISGTKSWNDMEDYVHEKEDFLGNFLDIPNGVFSNIDSEQFEQCFIQWGHILAGLQLKEIIAIDGKTILKESNSVEENLLFIWLVPES